MPRETARYSSSWSFCDRDSTRRVNLWSAKTAHVAPGFLCKIRSNLTPVPMPGCTYVVTNDVDEPCAGEVAASPITSYLFRTDDQFMARPF